MALVVTLGCLGPVNSLGKMLYVIISPWSRSLENKKKFSEMPAKVLNIKLKD